MGSEFFGSGGAAFSSEKEDWTTPKWLFDLLDSEFSFDLDAASSHENALCEKHYTEEEDGLSQPWEGSVFCNPPYGRSIGKWVEKAAKDNAGGVFSASCASAYGHEMVSRVGLPIRYGTPIYTRSAQIRRRQRLRSVPVGGSRLRQEV